MIEGVDYPSAKILALWPDCVIQRCVNKCCRSQNSIYCWPHTKSDKSLDDIISEINQTLALTK